MDSRFSTKDYDVFEAFEDGDGDTLRNSFLSCVSGQMSRVEFLEKWKNRALYDYVLDFLDVALSGYPSEDVQRSAGVLRSFLERLFSSVRYEGEDYGLSFDKIDDVWHAILENLNGSVSDVVIKFSLDADKGGWREVLDSGLVTFPFLQEVSSVLVHLRTDLLFSSLCEDYVCGDRYDSSCLFGYPSQVYVQLHDRAEGMYVNVVNNDKYFVQDSVVYHVHKGGTIFSADSVFRKMSESLMSEVDARNLVKPAIHKVGYFSNYDAIMTVLGNVSNPSHDWLKRRKVCVKLALKVPLDRNRRDGNANQYVFGGALEFRNANGSSFLRSMDVKSPYYWKDSSFLHEFLRYNVDVGNSNWDSFVKGQPSHAKKMLNSYRKSSLRAHKGLSILNKHLYDGTEVYSYEFDGEANGDLRAMGMVASDLKKYGGKEYVSSGDPHIISETLRFDSFKADEKLQGSILCDLLTLKSDELKSLEYFFVGRFDEKVSERVNLKKGELNAVDIRLPYCLQESFLYHLLYEKSVTEDWMNEWCKSKLVGSQVYVFATKSVHFLESYDESSMTIECNGERYSLRRDYGVLFIGFVYSENMEPYSDRDVWWVFETYFHLLSYWEDCYKIFEYIVCRMINPLHRVPNFRLRAEAYCSSSGSSVTLALPLGSSFSVSLYDSMLRFFERLAEELLPSDSEMLQPVAREFLVRGYVSRSGRLRRNVYTPEALDYEQEMLELSQRLVTFQSQYVRLIEYFMSNSLLSREGSAAYNESNLRWNSFLDFVLYHVAIRLGMTPGGLHYLLNLSDHSQLVKDS